MSRRNNSVSSISTIDKMPVPSPADLSRQLRSPTYINDSTAFAIDKINQDLFLSYKKIITEQYSLLVQYQLHYDSLYQKYQHLRKVKYHTLKQYAFKLKDKVKLMKEERVGNQNVGEGGGNGFGGIVESGAGRLNYKQKYEDLKAKYRHDVDKLTN